MTNRTKKLIVDGKLSCSRCKKLKLLADFPVDKRATSGRASECKRCRQDYYNQLYRKNPDRRKLLIQKATIRNRKAKYGVSWHEFEELLKTQNHRCRICNILLDESSFSLRPQLDHCHKKGTVRGILCGRCNTAIGLFKDSPELLLNAAVYLENDL